MLNLFERAEKIKLAKGTYRVLAIADPGKDPLCYLSGTSPSRIVEDVNQAPQYP
jgi:hypothetical protein